MENPFTAVSKEEAELEIAKALIPFLNDDGTPVNIRRDGWVLTVSTSVAGAPQGRTERVVESDWRTLVDAVTTFGYVTGQSFYSTAMVAPGLGTW